MTAILLQSCLYTLFQSFNQYLSAFRLTTQFHSLSDPDPYRIILELLAYAELNTLFLGYQHINSYASLGRTL